MGKLLERDIEEAFIEAAPQFGIEVLGRQVRVDVGIADIVGWFEHPYKPRPVVAEVKRGRAPQTAIAQLMGYMVCLEGDLNSEFPVLCEFPRYKDYGVPMGVIVAADIDPMSRRLLGVQHDTLKFIRYTVRDGAIGFEEVEIKHLADLPDEDSPVRRALIQRMRRHFGAQYDAWKWEIQAFQPRGVVSAYELRMTEAVPPEREQESVVWPRGRATS